MYTGDTYCHSSSIEVQAPVETVFDYLSDGVAQGDWTLGSMQRRKLEDNLYTGVSIFNGAEIMIRIDADRDNLVIYYHVGPEIGKLQPRNMVRILTGDMIGKDNDTCLVTLLSWRNHATDEQGWKLTCISHETEMFIIKNRLENMSETK